MAFIECKNLSMGYGGKKVIEGIDFSLFGGEYLCIIGENGAGKSTLMKGLLGLMKPIGGKIVYGGGLKPSQIGYLSQQNGAGRDFPASVFEVVLSGRLNRLGARPFYRREDKQDALKKMERLGIAPLKNQSFQELSGGQKQRVLLARALCAAEKMILLDEPAAGLDPVVTEELYGFIGSVNQNDGVTVIMVSHDLRAAYRYASHILFVSNRQLFFGKKEEFLKTAEAKQYGRMEGGKSDEPDF